MYHINQACIIATRSKTVDQDCYYDGRGFTLLRDHAKQYPNTEIADEAKPLIEEAFRHDCWIESVNAPLK